MADIYMHFLVSSPLLAKEFPGFTKATHPDFDPYLFWEAYIGHRTEQDILPSGAMHPAVIAGALFRAAGHHVHSTVYNVAFERHAKGELLETPFIKGEALDRHKLIIDKIAADAARAIAERPDAMHVIAESVPTGTLTAALRLKRAGIEVSPNYTSLHAVLDASAIRDREQWLEDHLYLDVNDTDDYAAFIGGIDEHLKVKLKHPLLLSGGLMPMAAVSNRVLHWGLPRQIKGHYYIAPNPLMVEAHGMPFLDPPRRNVHIRESPCVDDIRELFKFSLPTDMYNQGHVGDGVGLGVAIDMACEMISRGMPIKVQILNELGGHVPAELLNKHMTPQ